MLLENHGGNSGKDESTNTGVGLVSSGDKGRDVLGSSGSGRDGDTGLRVGLGRGVLWHDCGRDLSRRDGALGGGGRNGGLGDDRGLAAASFSLDDRGLLCLGSLAVGDGARAV